MHVTETSDHLHELVHLAERLCLREADGDLLILIQTYLEMKCSSKCSQKVANGSEKRDNVAA